MMNSLTTPPHATPTGSLLIEVVQKELGLSKLTVITGNPGRGSISGTVGRTHNRSLRPYGAI